MKPEDYGYVLKNNLCLFTKGPLSQWWGGFKNQTGGFNVYFTDMFLHMHPNTDKWLDEIGYDWDEEVYIHCCEQWMMLNKAALFGDTETFEKILNEKSPEQQKNLGREVKNFNPETWDREKFYVVFNGNHNKFSQNKELKEFLLSFNPNVTFVEAAPWDKVWGIGLAADNPDAYDIEKWQGENLLGKALTMVRDNFLYYKYVDFGD